MERKKRQTYFKGQNLDHLLAGTAAGACTTLVFHPLVRTLSIFPFHALMMTRKFHIPCLLLSTESILEHPWNHHLSLSIYLSYISLSLSVI